MKSYSLRVQTLLSTLWIFVLFNMVFRDLHQFANTGFIEELMALNIAEELVLVFGLVLEIPILMIVLSQVLKYKANKWANIIAVAFTALGMLSSMSSADMDDIFFLFMELAALMAILVLVLGTPSQTRSRTLDEQRS